MFNEQFTQIGGIPFNDGMFKSGMSFQDKIYYIICTAFICTENPFSAHNKQRN